MVKNKYEFPTYRMVAVREFYVEALSQHLFGETGKTHAHFSGDCLFSVEGLNTRFLESCKS